VSSKKKTVTKIQKKVSQFPQKCCFQKTPFNIDNDSTFLNRKSAY